jgi:hypothetical protein
MDESADARVGRAVSTGSPAEEGGRHPVLSSLALSIGLVMGIFALERDLLLVLADEGFLWYGAIRVFLGEVPIRDFQAYDVGRYYWAALWSPLLGQGIVALRFSTALFQVLGLTLGLLAARRTRLGWIGTVPLACVLAIWMLPWFKNVESSLLMAAVYLATSLVENPTRRRHLAAGILTGATALFGRNLGIYDAAAFSLLILILHVKHREGSLAAKLGIWAAGIVAGYSPMLGMLAFVPGFLDSFVDSLRLYLDRGATNIALPIPWPWSAYLGPLTPPNYAALPLHVRWPWMFYRFAWLLFPAFCVFGILLALRTHADDLARRALPIASACVGLPYLHHAFSRADILHLAPTLPPLLLGLAGLPAVFGAERRVWLRAVVVVALASAFYAGARFHPFYAYRVSPGRALFAPTSVAGDTLLVEKRVARLVEAVRRVHASRVSAHESLLILPRAPGLYAILGVRSPIWELYASTRPTEKVVRDLIPSLELRRVNWVLLADVAVDDREDLKLRHTHPEVWDYLATRFEPVEEPGLPAPYRLYRRREALAQ